MQKVFDDGIDLYTFAADAYYNGYKKLNMPYAEVRKKYRGAFKQGVISSIYTAGDYTLATGYDIQVHEVREVNKALFDNFQRLYDWQQEQINWNKANRTRIRTYLGDIRTTWEDNAKQTRQAVNLDVQGTCSLVATSGFNNLLKTATAKRMFLAPAVIVHDAIIAYAKARDIELIYDHYTENFLKFLGENYGFWFPFDIEIATNYYDKVLLSKKPEPRQYSVSGTNSSAFQVLDRCIKQGKKIKFLDEGVSLETIYAAINKNNHLYRQFHMGGGAVSFDRDFSYGNYNIEFID